MKEKWYGHFEIMMGPFDSKEEATNASKALHNQVKHNFVRLDRFVTCSTKEDKIETTNR